MSYILLSSAKHDAPNTRSFNEFKTTEELAKALVEHFEDYLLTRERCETGRLDSDDNSVEYKSDELYKFLDEFFGELCCLARQEDDPNLWIPYPKAWVKENCVYIYLRRQHEKTQKNPNQMGALNGTAHVSNVNSQSVNMDLIQRGSTSMDIDGVA